MIRPDDKIEKNHIGIYYSRQPRRNERLHAELFKIRVKINF